MKIDFKGFLKDNSKLILSLVGIFVIILLMGSTDIWKANGPNGNFGAINVVGGLDSNTNDTPVVEDRIATPVNNSKNDRYSSEPKMDLTSGVDYQAKIETSDGTIVIDLYENVAPHNVNSFVFLAREDFYDGTTFHRIIKDYIVQGGDPLGTGYGGAGYYLDDEISDNVSFKSFSVAASNAGVNTNSSQFFITTRKTNVDSLNGLYTIIGEVVSGFNVIDNIELRAVNADYLPFDPVMITDIQIIEN